MTMEARLFDVGAVGEPLEQAESEIENPSTARSAIDLITRPPGECLFTPLNAQETVEPAQCLPFDGFARRSSILIARARRRVDETSSRPYPSSDSQPIHEAQPRRSWYLCGQEKRMGRIGRSFHLVGQSYRILMQDKELMVLPLISGMIMAIVAGSFAFGFGLDAAAVERHGPDVYLPFFLIYVVVYAVGIFFQAAVVAGATERMRGGDPTVGSSLAAAGRRFAAIVIWAIIAATVGVVIRAIHDRVGFVGKIISGLLGAAWSLATFFIVPVLVLEDWSPRESFTRSVTLFKETWGETVAGGISIGVAAVCAWVTLIAFVGLLASVVGVIALAVFAVGALFLSLFFSTLQGIYVAALYRYATEGLVPDGMDKTLFDHAFVPKR